jgi:molybdopterin-guanine dinucleotide biosynthesis protein A
MKILFMKIIQMKIIVKYPILSNCGKDIGEHLLQMHRFSLATIWEQNDKTWNLGYLHRDGSSRSTTKRRKGVSVTGSTSVGVAILAGGTSRRMGMDKAWALLHGQPLVAHVIARQRPLAPSQVLVIAREPARFFPLGVEACNDIVPDQGPLGGLHTALHTLQTEHVALVGCDMPYASPAIFAQLIAIQAVADVPFAAVVPSFRGLPQPLHALYHRSALPIVERRLAGGELRMVDLVAALQAQTMDVSDGRAFLNLNTPEDLANAPSP